MLFVVFVLFDVIVQFTVVFVLPAEDAFADFEVITVVFVLPAEDAFADFEVEHLGALDDFAV